MSHQMEFWILEHAPPPSVPAWKDLGAEERTALVAILVRMIAKAVDPQLIHETEEQSHER